MKKRIRLIKAGWGSSGYYAAEMLKETGPAAFPIGTRMLDTHINNNPKGKEATQGVSAFSMLARTVSEAEFLNDPEDGEGLYAEIQFYDVPAQQLGEDRINDSEFSIFTAVEYGEEIEIDGQRGRNVDRLIHAPITSIDAVVWGGAGGKIATAQESKWCEDGSCQINGGVRVMAFDPREVAAEIARLENTNNTEDKGMKKKKKGAPKAAEKSLTKIVDSVRKAFHSEFNTDEDYWTYVSDVDDEGFVIADGGESYYRVTYSMGDDGYTFAPRDQWVLVDIEINYIDRNAAETADETTDKEVNNMELQEALDQIAALNGEMAALKEKFAKAEELLKTAQSENKKLAEKNAAYEIEKAVEAALVGVKFISAEAKTAAVSLIRIAAATAEDKATAITNAAEAYVSGKSSFVIGNQNEDQFGSENYSSRNKYPENGNRSGGQQTSNLSEALNGFGDVKWS